MPVIVGAVKVFEIESELDEVLFQVQHLLGDVERSGLADTGQGEVTGSGRREIQVAAFVEKNIQMPRHPLIHLFDLYAGVGFFFCHSLVILLFVKPR